ncbi:MAG TPA: di-heme oxidoredictase family protein [Opitutaceae bacterium]|nr:di-heme oxidoredictase family protein [Opitutaceae bacterium]
MKIVTLIKKLTASGATAGLCCLTMANLAYADNNNNNPTDPGVRSGSADAGNMLPGLTTDQSNAFVIAQTTFGEVDSVSGTLPGETGSGLGPSFNLNSCAGCHVFPSIGGSSPFTNPQIRVATLDGAHNVIPSFISATGPVREARFKLNPDGSPDGGVHDLFVITGRSDAPAGFALQQTDFASQVSAHNVIFRIPSPTFGDGLIEMIPDRTISDNKLSNTSQKSALGIAGTQNRSGNDGTVTRFGWKAQNKSLLMFASEAYNVEQGVTNDLFPNPRETGGFATPTAFPEDTVDLATGGISDIENFMIFMRLLDAPQQRIPTGISATSVANGQNNFNTVGCVLCHSTSMKTGPCSVAALSNKDVFLFSDLLIHHMGPGLADGVSQGGAAGDQFRSAPLWGLGQRIFLLHDGRTTNLITAIEDHASNANSTYPASEANKVVQNYNNLSSSQQQDLLNFLRSL